MIPEGAILETELDNIAVYDVSDLLFEVAKKLKDKRIKTGKKPKLPFGRRDPRGITSAIVHKSGASGPAGYDGCVATTSFVVYHRGWDGPAYTFWFAKVPDRDPDNRLVVYRMQPDNVKSWHTGGIMNEIGIGLGVQGNYDSQWDLLSNGLPKIDISPTDNQWEMLESFLPYIQKRYGIDFGSRIRGAYGLTGHWEHGKLVCPGDALRYWVIKKREKIFEKVDIKVKKGEIDAYNFKPKEFQAALYFVGFDPGPIDGIIGERTRAALEEFQKNCGLMSDGWYGQETAHELQIALRQLGLVKKELFYVHMNALERTPK